MNGKLGNISDYALDESSSDCMISRTYQNDQAGMIASNILQSLPLLMNTKSDFFVIWKNEMLRLSATI